MTAAIAHQDTPLDHHGTGNAFLIALAIHALLILGIGFKLQSTDAPAPTIEVTLARHSTDKEPEESDYIAQFNQMGSGTAEAKQELTTDRVPPLDSTVFRETDVLQPLEQQTRKQQPSDQQVVSAITDSAALRDQEEDKLQDGSVTTTPQTVREIASLRAKLAQQRQQYSKLPRTLVLTATSAKASDHAEYLRHWIEWVEQVGNENYPEEARRKQIYGAIRLAVALERNGNVASVEILKSSGQRVLDQAAVRIVRLAAPFQPIPPSIQEDRVEIIRTWHFMPGDQFHSTSQ